MHDGDIEALHRARVAIKVCRYQHEAAAALGVRVRPDELRSLRRLQRELGAVTDLELMQHEIRRHARRHPGQRRALAPILRRIGRERERRRARVLAMAGRDVIVLTRT